MALPSFQESMAYFPEPWKTLVQKVDEGFRQEVLENFVILGKYTGNEKVYMNAWFAVGLAPGYHCFVECHQVASMSPATKEADKKFWVAELRDLIPLLSPSEIPDMQEIRFHGGMIHAKLGIDQYHVVGMVSLHQTSETKQSFAVLWKHLNVERPLVEKIMKFTLNEKLI